MLLLLKNPRYNQCVLLTSFHQRFHSGVVFFGLVCSLAGCTAAFGPGYTIEKQEILVHFIPVPEPRILIEADYTVRNTGNQPLNELEMRLPGRRRFQISNAQATWDSVTLAFASSPEKERNDRLTLLQPWLVASVHKLHLSFELQTSGASPSTLGFSNDAFFLPAQGWSPELLPSRGSFATGGIPPKKWGLLVTVPATFQVRASGKPPKVSRHNNERTLRAEQTLDDIYPFVIAGNYQSAQIGEGKQKIFFWTRSTEIPDIIHVASEALLRSTRAYDETFGSRTTRERSLWIVECPVVTGCFSDTATKPLHNLGDTLEKTAKAEMASFDTLMIDPSAGTQVFGAVAAPSLAASWLGYGKNPGFYGQEFPLSALPAFAASIGRDAANGPDARLETIRQALQSVPFDATKGTNEDRDILRIKSFLFFFFDYYQTLHGCLRSHNEFNRFFCYFSNINLQ